MNGSRVGQKYTAAYTGKFSEGNEKDSVMYLCMKEENKSCEKDRMRGKSKGKRMGREMPRASSEGLKPAGREIYIETC